MVVATDRRLYVSTDKGLFQARSNGRGYEAQSLAFDRYAPMRWPVVVDCDNPRRLYAGTSKGGMFRSDDAGQNWREINQGIIYKEIWSLAQHPRTGELYVGTGPARCSRAWTGARTGSTPSSSGRCRSRSIGHFRRLRTSPM